MSIHQLVKDTMIEHKNKIELFQWAIMSSVSSLIYAEYLSRMKQKHLPVKRIMVPPVKYVKELLSRDSSLINRLSDELIDRLCSNELFKKYSNAPEFVIFNEDNVEIIKTIFDLYIIPNIERRIPEAISTKFKLGDESPNQMIIEDNSIDLFDRKPLTDLQFKYIVDETVLQLLFTIPTMNKDIEPIEMNSKIYLTKDEVVIIDHQNAITPIHINEDIISNKDVIGLLKFITSTSIEEQTYGESAMAKGPNNSIVKYYVSSNPFNKVIVVDYLGICE